MCPGGALRVAVAPDFEVVLEGAVTEVARGRIAPSFLDALR